ncbi:MAG: class I SAM-dependent methyltransferase [Alphaproteobacteria bacterium]|nr:class I SAM-dependent methyltransferase [Alphaproteobacteria bacterium]
MTESFPADWLALRAPADRNARDRDLERRFAAWIAARLEEGRGQVRLLDLGSGTGNNHHHLAERLPGAVVWTLTDIDPDHLAHLSTLESDDIDVRPLDLSDLDVVAAALPEADAVTCSALLDLVSEDWLNHFCRLIAEAGIPLFAVLTYDGRIRFHPSHSLDIEIRDLVNRHQRGDKGFGPALGPLAAGRATAILQKLEYSVATAPSDWRLGGPPHSGEGDLIQTLIDGYAGAAAALAPDRKDAIDAWRLARRDTDRLGVGHLDLLAIPQKM